MNARAVIRLISVVLMVLGAAIAVCWGVSLLFDDPAAARHALEHSATILLALGATVYGITRIPYRIEVTNPDHVSAGVKEFTLNGEKLEGKLVPICEKGSVNQVKVVLG